MIVVQLKKSTPQTAINNNCKPFWMSSRKYNFSFFFPLLHAKSNVVSSTHVQRRCLMPIYVHIRISVIICNFYAAHQADFLFSCGDAIISSNIFIIQHVIAFVNVILLHSIIQNAIRIMCNIDLLSSLAALLQRTSFTFRSLLPWRLTYFDIALLSTNVSYR